MMLTDGRALLVRRLPLTLLIALSILAIGALPAYTQNVGSQAFALHGSTTYQGVESHVSFDWEALAANSGWQAAPVAVTNWTTTPFIETGPIKDCQQGRDCNGHPYVAKKDTGGNYAFVPKADHNLLDNGNYYYKSTYNGANWVGSYCTGTGCFTLGTYNLGRTSLEWVGVGSEASQGLAQGLGAQVNANYNAYRRNGSSSFTRYCWTNRGGGQGSISACNSSTHQWYIWD